MEKDGQVEGRIVIGGGELAAMQELPELIARFRERYPLVNFDLVTGNADVIKEQMEKGLIDIGVLMEPVDMEKFDFIRLNGKERWVVLMRPDDPLAAKEAVSAEDLKDKPLILPRRSSVQNEVQNWLGRYYSESQVLFTSNLTTNSALMVQRGLAYSLVIEGSVPFWDRRKIVCRPFLPELTANSVFAWKKRQPFSLAATKFIEHIKCFLGITQA